MEKNIIIPIGNHKIGEGEKTYIIAEIGINHNGSLEIAKQLIKLAAQCGANAVKFQKRSLRGLYQKKYLDNPLLGQRSIQYLLPIFEKVELSNDDYRQIILLCKEYNIQFLCTPFDKESVDFLEELHVEAYKIGSPDLTNFDLLDHVCKTKKPIIISTGMSTILEIEKTVKFLKERKAKFILLHCNSNYPAPFHCINLRVMQQLKKQFNVPVGYSGHEYGIAISIAAVAMGACVIERHFTLDRSMIGPDHAASLEPDGLKKMIRDIRNLEEAMGSNVKFLDRGEFMNREVLGKSLVAACRLRKGEKITREKIKIKSPGTGLSPQMIQQLIGVTLRRGLEEDEQFKEKDINQKRNLRKAKITCHHSWGIIVRPPDLEILVRRFSPPMVEMHLTDQDIQKGVRLSKNYRDISLVVHVPEYWNHDLVDFVSDEIRIRELSYKVLDKTIEITKKISKNFKKNKSIPIIIHPGGMTQLTMGYENNVSYKYRYDYLKDLYRKFTDRQIEILIENMPPFPWYFGGQWKHTVFLDEQEIANFCNETKKHICFDLSHAALYCNDRHKDLVQFADVLLPYTRHIHIADAAGVDGEGLQIGDGSIRFEDLNKFFSSYQNAIVPEIWQGHKNKGDGFYIALNKLKDRLFSL